MSWLAELPWFIWLLIGLSVLDLLAGALPDELVAATEERPPAGDKGVDLRN